MHPQNSAPGREIALDPSQVLPAIHAFDDSGTAPATAAQRRAIRRDANARIQELRAQWVEQPPPEATQLHLTHLHNNLEKWWKEEGLGRLRHAHFGRNGCEMKLSCELFNDAPSTGADTPFADEAQKHTWLQSLEARGFLLLHAQGESSVRDCAHNRRLLTELISRRLPSGVIDHISNQSDRYRSDGFSLKGVTLLVSNIADLA